MLGVCINRYRLIIGRLLDADYRPADNRPLPYRGISNNGYDQDQKSCPQDHDQDQTSENTVLSQTGLDIVHF